MEADGTLALDNIDAIECFNLGCERLCHEGHGEWAWDLLLRHGRHVLGICSDDTHSHTVPDDRFGGYLMVNAGSLTIGSVISSLKRGNYYSTMMGPSVYDWGIDGDYAYIECSPVPEIHLISYPARGKATFGKAMTDMSYELTGNESYLRIEIIDEDGNRAYTNLWYF